MGAFPNLHAATNTPNLPPAPAMALSQSAPRVNAQASAGPGVGGAATAAGVSAAMPADADPAAQQAVGQTAAPAQPAAPAPGGAWLPGTGGAMTYPPGEGPVTGQVPGPKIAKMVVRQASNTNLSGARNAARGVKRAAGAARLLTNLRQKSAIDPLVSVTNQESALRSEETENQENLRKRRLRQQQKAGTVSPLKKYKRFWPGAATPVGEGGFKFDEKPMTVYGREAWPDKRAAHLSDCAIGFLNACRERGIEGPQLRLAIKRAAALNPAVAKDLEALYKVSQQEKQALPGMPQIVGRGLVAGGKKLLSLGARAKVPAKAVGNYAVQKALPAAKGLVARPAKAVGNFATQKAWPAAKGYAQWGAAGASAGSAVDLYNWADSGFAPDGMTNNWMWGGLAGMGARAGLKHGPGKAVARAGENLGNKLFGAPASSLATREAIRVPTTGAQRLAGSAANKGNQLLKAWEYAGLPAVSAGMAGQKHQVELQQDVDKVRTETDQQINKLLQDGKPPAEVAQLLQSKVLPQLNKDVPWFQGSGAGKPYDQWAEQQLAAAPAASPATPATPAATPPGGAAVPKTPEGAEIPQPTGENPSTDPGTPGKPPAKAVGSFTNLFNQLGSELEVAAMATGMTVNPQTGKPYSQPELLELANNGDPKDPMIRTLRSKIVQNPEYQKQLDQLHEVISRPGVDRLAASMGQSELLAQVQQVLDPANPEANQPGFADKKFEAVRDLGKVMASLEEGNPDLYQSLQSEAGPGAIDKLIIAAGVDPRSSEISKFFAQFSPSQQNLMLGSAGALVLAGIGGLLGNKTLAGVGLGGGLLLGGLGAFGPREYPWLQSPVDGGSGAGEDGADMLHREIPAGVVGGLDEATKKAILQDPALKAKVVAQLQVLRDQGLDPATNIDVAKQVIMETVAGSSQQTQP